VTGSAKPFRRTAWTLLIVGVAASTLMLGGSALVVSQGETAGSDHTARWPAGADVGVFRPARTDTSGTKCTVTQADGQADTIWPEYGERLSPTWRTEATIGCEPAATILTGGKLTIAQITRGAWIAVPLFLAILGALLFVPRFTMVWASLTQPIGRLIRRRSEGGNSRPNGS
jgi:hypothetical protein